MFIGVGGSGRWILTHICKNLIDSGAGYLPEGIRFLLLDTDEHEKINGQEVSVAFAGVELESDDIFVLDENLQERVREWASQGSPNHLSWFEARRYEGLNEQLNLVNGTFGMRQLPRVALLRNVEESKELNSQWVRKQVQAGRDGNLISWIQERCQSVYRQDQDEVRVFIVGSLAGGMSSVILDIANMTRQIAGGVITSAGSVSIEGYFIDAVPFETLPGAQNAGMQRQANAYISLREIARWQLNPGLPFMSEWKNNKLIEKDPFDDILIFSGQVGSRSNLEGNEYPGIADVITTRLDRATGAGSSADWFTRMRTARSDRQRSEHDLMIGSAGAHTVRLPVADILRALYARWSYNLLRIFLSGERDKDIQFDYRTAGDPGFPYDPEYYVPAFLNGNLGGDAPLESEVLADIIQFETSDLLTSDELKSSLGKSLEEYQKDANDRLDKAIMHILFGSQQADVNGSRAGRLAYALELLRILEEKMNVIGGKLSGDMQQPELAQIANCYAEAASERRDHLEKLKTALTFARPGTSYGLVEKLQKLDSDLASIRDDLDKIKCRRYFWGKMEMDNTGNLIEVPFLESWWSEYLAGKEERYTNALGWTVTDDGVDLELWIDRQPVKLLKDGVDKIIDGLNHIAGSLTASIWQGTNLSLADVASSYNYFTSSSEGETARKRSMEMGIMNVGTDPGIPVGRSLYVAPESMQRIGNNTPFQKGIDKALPEETSAVAVETSVLNGTDRMSATLLRLQDAVNIERLIGYQRAAEANKLIDGWNSTSQRFEGDVELPRATQRAEFEAWKIERLPNFVGFENLNPLVVASLQYPAKAELFCLALADGLIFENPKGQIILEITGSQGQLPLLIDSRPQIDPYVDALLNWSLKLKSDSWEKKLIQRFSNVGAMDRSRIDIWLKAPPNKFAEGLPDRRSLGQLTSVLSRLLLTSGSRRWDI